MFCFRIRKKLYDFLEGDLSREAAAKVETHLKRCPGCARVFREMRQILQLTGQKRPPEPSREFWQGFDRELAARMGREDSVPVELEIPVTVRFRRRLRPAFALATVTAVLLIAFSLYLVDKLPVKTWLVARSERALVEETAVLEETTGEVIFLETEDDILAELDLLEELT